LTGGLSRAVRWPLGVLRRLVGVIPAAIDGFFRHRSSQFAAGIAYRILFSLAPLAIVLVSVFGLILQDDAVRGDVIDLIVDHLPFSQTGAQNVENAIVAIATPASAIGFVSLFVFVWAATGMMASIRAGLENALEVERGRPAVRGKLVDLVLIVGTAVLVLVVAGLSVLGDIVRRGIGRLTSGAVGGLTELALKHGIPLLLSTIVVLLLYRFVPTRRIRLKEAVAGAFVTAVLLLAISLASGYIYDKTTRLSVVYGSLTAALVFLYSVYLYACAVLFGAEVASAWAKPPAEASDPVWMQVKNAVLGLFVHRDDDGVEEPTRPPSPPS
jgi:membrane protein